MLAPGINAYLILATHSTRVVEGERSLSSLWDSKSKTLHIQYHISINISSSIFYSNKSIMASIATCTKSYKMEPGPDEVAG